MSLCAKCGSEIAPDSPFCGSCGAPAPGAGAAPTQAAAAPIPPQAAASPPPPPPGMAPTPPPMAGAPAYGPPVGPPVGPAYQPPKSGGGGKVVLFGLLGLLVIGIIVVLVLGFAGPKWFVSDSGGGSNGPEQTVNTFFKAMENKDSKLLLSTFSPSSMQALEDQMGSYYTDLESLFSEMMFSTYESMKFEGLKFKTTITGDTATVKVVEGKATIVDSDGAKTTEDVKNSDAPADLQLIKENGKWYIDYENM